MMYFSAWAPFLALLKKGPSMFTPRSTAPWASWLNRGFTAAKMSFRISSLNAMVVPIKLVTPWLPRYFCMVFTYSWLPSTLSQKSAPAAPWM